MKTMQGVFAFALLNSSLTRLAPTPTNISTNSEAEIEKKGTSASPAIARANNVFPVPGGPINKTPLGVFAPRSINICGFFKKVTISFSSSDSSFKPATSSKVYLLISSGFTCEERLEKLWILFNNFDDLLIKYESDKIKNASKTRIPF